MFAFLISGCKKENAPIETFLEVSNSKLTYLGETLPKSKLTISRKDDATVNFSIKTVFIAEKDEISSIKVSVINENTLVLKIDTKPYGNPDWKNPDKLTKVHQVEFEVAGLKAGSYNLNLDLNNVSSRWENHVIK